MPSTRNLRQNRPLLFSPSVIRQVQQDDLSVGAFQQVDFETLSSSSLENTGSFRYNLVGDGLKSTQQLNVDWSAFENHTFFNSAQVKTNVAFKKIFVEFPFDGTRSEYETFMDGLSGFEKYVYDQFPKNKGYLFLSGTKMSEPGLSGTYVMAKDIAGVTYPGVSRNVTGTSILNPQLNSMTLEFQVFVPPEANFGSYLVSKVSNTTVSGTHGFAAFMEQNLTTTGASIKFFAFSGSYQVGTTVPIVKNQWNHMAFVWDRSTGNHVVKSYLNGTFVNSSSQVQLGLMNMDSADILVGSGSMIPAFTPVTTFSGALDEVRVWHTARTQEQRDEHQQKSVFAQPDLKLYYKFNEASGSQTPIVIDSSGNSLHGNISDWAVARNIREIPTGSVAGQSPMTYELLAQNPVLFPQHPEVEELNATFLENAEEFDRINPNRIDRLIPKHYLLQGQDQDGLSTEEGTIIDALVAGDTGNTAQLGDTQVILMLLYTWAKFFDEMKLFTQAFSTIMHLDYDSTDTVPDAFLQMFANKFGITLPPLFTGSSIAQFINAENLETGISTGNYSLQFIQNQIWRRILLNIQDVLKSKGTIHSVKSFIRSVGIEPDNNFRIREFGGPTIKALTNVREDRSEVSTLIDFSGGGHVQSLFLSGARKETEKGFPGFSPMASFVNGIDNQPNDGLFTSGSWTFEGSYRFPSTSSLTTATQSLVRVQTTGSMPFVVANLLATQNGLLRLAVCPSTGSSNITDLTIPVDIFDGGVWSISFGRQRADEVFSTVSSSYFLRAAKQSFGEVTDIKVTSSFINEQSGSTIGSIVWSNLDSLVNPSGSYLSIGSETIATGSSFLNAASASLYRTSAFEGRAGQFRFWSKALTQTEWVEHVRNFKSLGVENPLVNFNFVSNQTGSFGRLRMDVSSDQMEVSSSVTGTIDLVDFSQNNLKWSGTAFPVTSSVIVPQLFQYSLLSPKFDVGATTDKVRVRSFQDYSNVLSSSYAQVAPVYALEPSERPQDNTRFTVDFSVVDALDQDIINIFANLDILDNVIGNPELVFSPDYPDLENLRNIYFNRLTEMVNLKGFFEFYKWFDTNIGQFIAQLLPRKTKFLGTNFVIESHMLERPKVEYLFSDIYLGDSNRHALKDTILFQQFVASLMRF